MSQCPYHLGFTTLTSETSVDELPIRGTIPEWLTGTLIRTGPARFEVGNQSYNHWFDGLAMLHRYGFAAGHVSYANRYLRSRAYEETIAKGAISEREFATDPCRTLFQRVVSWFSPRFTDNGCVNISRWHDAVVALTETRLPVQFDPQTLATIGIREYDRHIKGPVSTAHPHFDRARRCCYTHVLDFGWRSKYRFFSIDEETGQESIVATIPVDRPAYLHSFGMTERYLVLVEFPLVVNPLELLLSGKPFIRNYHWRPDRGTRFHIIEKDSGRVLRTARGSTCFAFHHVNAFEEGDDVVVDIIIHPDATVIDQLYLEHLRSANSVHAAGKFTRFRIGTTGDVTSEQLSDVPVELPRFNYGRLAGRRQRFVYAASQEPSGDFFDRLVKLDLDGGGSQSWQEQGCYPGEPVFVAAPDTADEDAGVILSVVLDTRRRVSFLLILNSRTFEELARAEAPHHIPFSFHGNYLK